MIRILALAAVLMASMPAWAGGVAVIDFQRALQETNEGKELVAKLEKMYAEKRAELEQKQVALEAEIKDFETRRSVLVPSALEQEGQALMQKQAEFQQLLVQYDAEIQQTEIGMLKKLEVKMRTISEKIAKEKGYDLVLDRAAVVYMGGATIDMTDALVQRYNAAGN